ncbi:MAG TPA: hypothetical protein H9718_02285 [Candidatus Limosilactobacillus gallistercoris]|uniref:hypothetical protein n=1 Tax=Limosilactobacillus pontis TaxID=35787 RepID=UPI001C39F710|nr:hypothetical protein [Limosilactobacillus pontis]MDM8331174.1 hypothetical protein [Limosilactobacillus pontis]HJA74495.1 hypothetical protein [Candidatus Limosilactobacillus gallistercoris]
MLKQYITRTFLNNLLLGNGALVGLIILYNLLAMLIPIVKLAWPMIILVFILINAILIGLKVIVPLINQQRQP